MKKWYEVYSELAKHIYKFQKNAQTLSGEQLYSKCISNSQFTNKNPWIKRLAEVKSLDPFHIYSSFSGSGMKAPLREIRIKSWLELFSVKIDYDFIDFTGCPTPFSIRIFSIRQLSIQQEIWFFFEKLVSEKQAALDEKIFRNLKKWYGIDISAFTILLYWIDSKNFLPLDKNTTRLLIEFGIIQGRPRSYAEYVKLIPRRDNDFYLTITNATYHSKIDIKGREYFKKLINSFYNISVGERTKPENIDFKIIAIRALKGTNKKYLKVLPIDKTFVFYKAYQFQKGTIQYTPNQDINLYNTTNIDVNISAIVGKNGAGKSTLTELIYLAINNISAKYSKYLHHKLQPIKDVNLELFYKTDKFYKITIIGSNVRVFELKFAASSYIESEGLEIKKFELNNFFYSIAVNFSHYALNSKDIGDWIVDLFYKNDGYQVPITITPMRDEGNIDINDENEFVISRLLANILEPISEDEPENLRQLTEAGKSAQKIKVSINKWKVDKLYSQKPLARTSSKTIIADILKYFNIPRRNSKELAIAKLYLFQKLIKICTTYPPYFRFYNKKSKSLNISKLEKLLKSIEADDSHVAYKFKQAINYLKYDELFNIEKGSYLNVEDISDIIESIKSKENDFGKEIKTIELVPPSFFKIEIQLNDGSSFNDLSSGEKQQIYTINSLIYHLSNLNSIAPQSQVIHYDYVNILLDEIELYFHPNMQRKFVSYLLKYLNRIPLENIFSLNFCFVTHSPFILSDIPVHNILFLDPDDKKEILIGSGTLGSNIHELLTHGFFMDNTIGEYALGLINEIISFHGKVQNLDLKELPIYKNEYQKHKTRFAFIIGNIGDDIIRDLLFNHLMEIDKILKEKYFVDLEIARLEREILDLKAINNA